LDINKLIIDKNACCTIDEIANNQKCTDRTVQRLFKAYVGILPKDYLKIIRFNNACKLLSQYPDIDWFDIVYSCGYYDQMHFIHEFKSIMNCPPLKFLEKCEGKFYFFRPLQIIQTAKKLYHDPP
jgi:AraC-like DNA-binding protein